MLDLSRLHAQLSEFESYQAASEDRRQLQLKRALSDLKALSTEWKTVRRHVEEESPKRLVAGLTAAPTTTFTPPDRPPEVTVVASDGSQIYPDRHVEPTYFLLNVSTIAFQYGTTESPRLDATPELRFRQDLDALFDDVLGSMSTDLVSALRDEMELDHLLTGAKEAHVSGRPLVALADGTLIRWMIRGMRNQAVEDELIRRYTERLTDFQTQGLPLASYISMPGNTELVNLLRFYRGELQIEEDWIDDETPTLRGLLDRTVVGRILDRGERTVLFRSASHILEDYPEGQRICYFYLKVPAGTHRDEVARVELPQWVAETDGAVDLLHTTILDDCRKGDGYPVALSEAHERAVIRAPERESFFRLMERRLRNAGLPTTGSQKRLSKQRPKV